MGRKRTARREQARAPSPPQKSRRGAVVAAGVLIAIAAVALIAWAYRDTTPAIARDGSPSWSPDGREIVFYSERDGNSEIYVMAADGSNQRRLTNTPSDEGYPSWSPDGRSIAFDSDRDGNFEIYVMNADGTAPRRLTSSPGRDVSASWSPDGTQIAFMSDRDGAFDVYVMNAAGSNPERRTNTGTAWFPVWSPDGSRLAFHVGRDVHVTPRDGSHLARLTIDPDNGMYPSWSADGAKIAFMSWRTGRTELFVMNADGTDQKKLVTMERGDAIDPRWSPDGSKIAFVHLPDGMSSAARAIHTINADGTGLKKLSR
jgi:Tol biopolymer transport system component